jgi:uncharacterized Zn-binding protein involved in type VI secretion
MPPMARVGDQGVGVCKHPVKPYIFPWIGIITTTPPDVLADFQPVARVGATGVTTCPICHTFVCDMGWPLVNINGLPVVRLGDRVTSPGGRGLGRGGSRPGGAGR